MKCCNSVVIGDIDAYLYHMGDDLVGIWCSVVGVVAVMGKYLISTHTFVYHYMFASNMSVRLLTAWGSNGWKVTEL
jgi:hypothetical protein